ncbi:MAG: trypsin-like peptidase domain-containing protein [Planctomycetes bacterium]|nr:trypsin-like peptidase domain-containing protein [Planctomycetota bacterium]
MNALLWMALSAGVASAAQEPPPSQEEPSALERIERDVAAVVERARKSVVQVTVRCAAMVDRMPVSETVKLSGVVYSEDGVILTDAGGLDSAVEVRVTLPEGHETFATVVAVDPQTSIGVLRIKATGLTPAEFTDSPEIRQGSFAVVVGNPMGLRGSSSVGFLSGTGRSIVCRGRRFDDMLQLTTSVQPGDCGGFVADARGRLIGMVHSNHVSRALDPASMSILMLLGKNGANFMQAGIQMTAFATPSSVVRMVAERILKYGRMVRGWAGLSVRPIDLSKREQLDLPPGHGGEIFSVDKSGPARKAGLKRGDILLSFDGEPVSDLQALRWKVQRIEEPRDVKVVILRGDERLEKNLRVELEPQP